MGCHASVVTKVQPSAFSVETTESESDLDSAIEQEVELGIKLLQEKGVLECFDLPRVARQYCEEIRNPETATGCAIRERLLQLVRKHDKHYDTADQETQTFRFEDYRDYESILIADPRVLVHRVQDSGLCYMHAPAVVQYYSIWFATLKEAPDARSEHQMLDITADILRHFDKQALYRHVFLDEGGQSLEYLQRILEPNTNIFQATANEAADCLRKYGPGLVSNFKVHADFEDHAVRKHLGKPSGDARGHHAMVIVGAQKLGEKWLFLLQNWWRKKQFVEVDDEYFAECNGRIHFVASPQRAVPQSFSTLGGRWFEAMDTAERLNLERSTRFI